ncbi:MAG TPA: Lrp/AsnC family transcriptional regulator [Acidobacteriota bacterium]|nr:Lrp/AsnC family transcriptional regulator [Acidobacteriota bacterium]HNB73765.1 Lrp/AsnC family transcriptional regulator [Acidobacteriota bacterium]HND22119.1 Lrp/AsnC family transcriptional regulator [Acidobacteriota bacterium]HNG95143.1 Lrp/AsnC family transcriptional regulator [Acidobacteriota bacterium]HNH81958.1 Lrp/AsnC family transcriptional regulator [Acidobacteriota bacterium]
MIDEIDSKILTILQKEARTSNAEIARQLGMAPSGILERIRKLEERGVIQGYRAEINPKALGLGLLAFVAVRSNDRVNDIATGKLLAQIPGVLEVHDTAGEDCYLVKIRAADTESLGKIIRTQIGTIPSVLTTRTTIVLETLKESTEMPI